MKKGAAAVRRLALFAYAFSAAALLVCLVKGDVWPAVTGGALILLYALLRLLWKKRPKWLPPVLIGLAVGLLWSCGWNRLMLAEAGRYDGSTETVEAIVVEYPAETAYGESVTVRVGRVKCRLYLDERSGLMPGEHIRFTARFSLTEEKTGEDYFLSVGLPLFAYGEGMPELLGPAKGQWRFFPAKLGARLRANIAAAFDEASAPFLTAILTGDRTALKRDGYLYAMLQESGVVHCVAVSGMHLSFLTSFLYVLLGRGRVSSLVCMPVILLFMAVTGFTPSVVRAGVMQLAVCLASLFRQDYDSRSALGLALLLLAAWNPYSLLNVGLQLSFASTLGILLFSSPIQRALPKLPEAWEKRRLAGHLSRYVRSSLSVSLSAQIFTAPITAVTFGQFALIAPLTNLCVLWAVSLCFGFGLLAALLGFCWPAGAVILGFPARICVRYIAAVVKFLGRLPFASLYPDGAMVGLWLLCAYALLLAFRFLPGISHRLRGFACAFFLTLGCFWGMGQLLYRSDALCAAVLDVGQGQCTVFMDRESVVVTDCGGSGSTNAGDLAARYLLSRGRSRVDALVLTHFHTDHAGGALELLRRLPVEKLFVPPPEPENEAAAEILREAEALGVQVVIVEEVCQSWQVGELKLRMVPPLGYAGDNEEGLCALLSRGDFDLLVTGDASQATEQRLLDRIDLPDVEVLAVGHHGSRTSTLPRLLETCAPDAAVISVGRNSYGMPAAETLENLASAGVTVWRTDEAGTVEFRVRDRKGASE